MLLVSFDPHNMSGGVYIGNLQLNVSERDLEDEFGRYLFLCNTS